MVIFPEPRGLIRLLSPIFLLVVLVGCYRIISKSRGTPPRWVTILPQKRGWIFAVGYSPPFREPEDAWIKAEIQARENLAKTMQVKVGEVIIWQGYRLLSLSKEEIDEVAFALAWLGGQVMGQYADPREGIFYVLVGMPTDSSPEALLQRKASVLRRLDGLNSASAEEIRQKAHQALGDLERVLQNLHQRKAKEKDQ